MSKLRPRRLLAGLTSLATAVGALTIVIAPMSTPAQAADVPTAPGMETSPETVTADALPTVQINGVVWDQVVVGNTVYAGGEFTNARPAGAAPGVNTVPRSNLLAFDIRTGELVASWAPTLNGKVSDLAVSPDGTKLGVVGNFTQVNGVARYRSAVFNLPSGTLSNVSASLDAPAQAVAMSNNAMYVGGYFSRIGSTSRPRIGAVSLTNGAVLPFNVPIDNRQVRGLVLSPDGSQIVIAGNFSSVGGSSEPGYGLYRADSTTGAGLPLPINSRVRNGGDNAAILKLDSDSTSFYGVGYHFGAGGTTEGAFQGSWADGSLVNIEDCHGDTYDVAPIGGVVYQASHKHYCGNSGGFPQTNPWTYWPSTAWTKESRGTNTRDIYGYPDHPGIARPGLLPWFPQTDFGSYTASKQSTWSVKGNDKYVVMGGEFPRVNGQQQQGLVRFAVSSLAPKKQGPRPTTSAAWEASAQSLRRGQVKVTWPTLWDRDDLELTYRVWRQTSGNVVHEVVSSNTQWGPSVLSFTDKNATPGANTRYYVQASDPDGNVYGSGWTNVTVASADQVSAYGAAILDDGATKYWPLNEPSGSTVVSDYAGDDNTTSGSGTTRGVAGAMSNSTDAATAVDGTANGRVYSQSAVQGPDTFSQEVWFKTTTTSGGKIAGFGNSNTGDSGSYDRHIYMDGDGRVVFGVYPGAVRTVSSKAGLNDGKWHQAVATLGKDGMALYVDGKRVASRTDTTNGQNYLGYWRLGGDNLGGWADGNAFEGAIDDYSVFPTALSPRQVDAHWQASGREAAVPPRPVDALGAAVYDSSPDLYWRLDETNGDQVADAASGSNTATSRGDVQKGRAGLLGGKAAKLGTSPWGVITGNNAVANPTTFSQEVWIKGTTQDGGRILGFGNSDADWFSSNYDRALWMLNNGRVRFGIWSGQTNTIDSERPLNDGEWHQVVSTFDNNGMRLYVDGELQGTNSNAVAQDYNGYWKVGADSHWGDANSAGFGGDVDEVAVFPRALSADEIRSHYRAGSGAVPNAAPTARFSSTVAELRATFDASDSSDPEGSTLAYEWDFGDGKAGTGKNAEHTYDAAGTYTVSLKVTDAAGASDVRSGQVSVERANVEPTAAFTASATALEVAVDASDSTDPDGTVASYSWNWGDGSPADTGRTATHTYATAGEKTITLTVTDNRGATATTSRSVTVRAATPAGALAQDGFDRTLASGWGRADVGGPWTLVGGNSRFTVGDSAGTMIVPSGVTLTADQAEVSSTSSVVTTEFSIDKLVEGQYIGVTGRKVGANSYVTRIRVAADGSARLWLLRNNSTVVGSVYNLPFNLVPGQKYSLKMSTTGSSPTSLSAKVWSSAEPEPAAWQRTATDDTAGFQAAGSVGLFSWLPNAASASAPVRTSFSGFVASAK